MRRLERRGDPRRDARRHPASSIRRCIGPGFYPKLSQEVLATQSRPGDGWGKSTPEEQARRSIYIHVKRSLLPPLLTAFDFPDVDASCEARFITTQPAQALAMLNGEFLNEQAAKLADARDDRSRRRPAGASRARDSTRARTGRRPTRKSPTAWTLLNRLTNEHGQTPPDALQYWCLTVLNLNEFVYLD